MNLLDFLQIYLIHIFCNVICIMCILNLCINDDSCEYWPHIYIYILHNMFGIVLRKFLVLLISLKSTFKYQVKISAYVADEYVKVLVIK